MGDERQVRHTEKKVDESWKDKVDLDKKRDGSATSKPPSSPSESAKQPSPAPKETSRTFLNLLTSLGYQAMMHLGDIPNPETKQPEVQLESAREIIDLLVALKEKSEGNLSPEESQMLVSLVSELQMKYASHA